MILVEDTADLRDLHVVRRQRRPRDVEDPVDVGADDGVLRRADLHRAEALELLARDRVGLLREVRLREALLEDVQVALVSLFLAELFLDGLELLAQHVFALVLAHLLLDLGVDALAHLEDLELPGEQPEHLADAVLDVDGREQRRLLVDGGIEVGGDEVGELAGLVDRVDERAGLARELGHQLDDLLRDVAQAHRECLGLDVVGLRLVEARHARLEIRRVAGDGLHAHAHEALEDERIVAARVLERLQHARCNADRIEIILAGVVRRGIALREDDDDRLAEVLDVLDERDRLLAAHVERRDGAGEQHGVADRQDGKLVGQLDLVQVDFGNFLLVVSHELLGGAMRSPRFRTWCARARESLMRPLAEHSHTADPSQGMQRAADAMKTGRARASTGVRAGCPGRP